MAVVQLVIILVVEVAQEVLAVLVQHHLLQ